MPAPTPTSDPKALTAELLGNILSYLSNILEREIEESGTGFGGYLLELNSIKRMKCIVLLQKGRCVCVTTAEAIRYRISSSKCIPLQHTQ